MGRRSRQPRLTPHETAERQSLFREVNEQIQGLGERFNLTGESVEIVCECGNDHCHELIALTAAEYERVRRSPARFVVLSGHEIPGVEHVVAANDGFLVVEKSGEGGRVATDLDPRRNGGHPGPEPS